MKCFTKYSLLLLTLIVFTTTIGFNVFAHFCKQDGTSISYVIPEKHTCERKLEIPSCCHKKETSNNAIEEKCCSEQIWSYKLSSALDYSTYYVSSLFIVVPSIDFNYFTPSYCYKPEIKVVYEYLPPPKAGKTILIANQVFRI